ncbi:MAG: hypothetical protein K0Q76_4012 [Panacagrimonas sp.]|jgi:hypothetical protein|nr:hypothetical protein [Panacagrimonas sp.]
MEPEVQTRVRSRAVPMLLWTCIATLFCVAISARAERRPRHPPVLERPPPALLSVLGDTPELRVTAVDNVPIAQIPERALLRDPRATTEKGSIVGVWLTPGAHLVHSQFVRNMADGINLSQGNVRLVAAPGRTYMIHPNVRSVRGKAAFEIVDQGTAFPQVCLPGVLDNAQRAQNGERFSPRDVGACLLGPRRR